MAKFKSIIQQHGPVAFPEPTGTRIYMEPVTIDRMSSADHPYTETVLDMIADTPIGIHDLMYLMVDESHVAAGQAQRRRGLHIDGYWIDNSIQAHGNNPHIPLGGHRMVPEPDRRWAPLPQHSASDIHNDWESATFEAPEAIILASTHRACRAFTGEFEGPIKEGGDCDHIDLSGLTRISLDPHTSYVGNVTALHESIPVTQDCYRQLVRLNVPGWTP